VGWAARRGAKLTPQAATHATAKMNRLSHVYIMLLQMSRPLQSSG
jgi:hypothetical protein